MAMRIIANENICGTVIRALKAQGHDVLAAKEVMAGASDLDVLQRAKAEKRLVITHDKDFGELAFAFGLPAVSGIVLFRLSTGDVASSHGRALTSFNSRRDWSGNVSVVDDYKIRMRQLKGTGSAQQLGNDLE